ncbi:hypothetical protein [Rhizobium jaguaris]|nr:hypothetical protein [Rhizobium jaguaris]
MGRQFLQGLGVHQDDRAPKLGSVDGMTVAAHLDLLLRHPVAGAGGKGL